MLAGPVTGDSPAPGCQRSRGPRRSWDPRQPRCHTGLGSHASQATFAPVDDDLPDPPESAFFCGFASADDPEPESAGFLSAPADFSLADEESEDDPFSCLSLAPLAETRLSVR